MKWTVAQARQNFCEMLKAAASEPQPIFNRKRPVAALVDYATFEAFEKWRAEEKKKSEGSLYDWWMAHRYLLEGDDYILPTAPRSEWATPFDAEDWNWE